MNACFESRIEDRLEKLKTTGTLRARGKAKPQQGREGSPKSCLQGLVVLWRVEASRVAHAVLTWERVLFRKKGEAGVHSNMFIQGRSSQPGHDIRGPSLSWAVLCIADG